MELEKLLNKDKYQVFLFTCPAIMPFSFAVHPWLVVNNKGGVCAFWRALDQAGEFRPGDQHAV